MSWELEIPKLASNAEIETRFAALQKKLVPLWHLIESLDDQGAQTIVVVPSLTVDFEGLHGSVLQAYEERFLFLLLLLQQPTARLIYVTSQPIHPNIVDYYLGLLPGVITSHARERLFLLAPHDSSGQPLSVKLLQRPRMLRRIRDLIPDRARAHLVPFNTTPHERDLAIRLGIPLYGADPAHLHFGTKSGCRRLFAETGVAHPAGYEDLTSVHDLVDAIKALRERRPDIGEAMVKHNDGVSGQGNAVLKLSDLDASSQDAVLERVQQMALETRAFGVDVFLEKFAEYGGIVEERIAGDPITSPSVQLRTTPTGRIELLSTHDQLLSGQTFTGCVFPADPSYAPLIAREAMKVASRLREENVLGRFAIDFVCGKTDDGWKPYAIELNLRKGGTTHPYLTLQFLTDGSYDAETATFTTSTGDTKCYIATDSLKNRDYRVFTPDDLFDVVVKNRLHFDPNRRTGVVLHMMSAVGDHGRLGFTAIGATREQAREVHDATVKALNRAAAEALVHEALPDL